MSQKAPAAPVENFADFQKIWASQFENMNKSFETAVSFAQENADVMRQVAERTGKLVETLATETTKFSQAQFDKTVASARDIAGAGNVSELLEKNAAVANDMLKDATSQSKKVGELVSGTIKDVAGPVQAQFSKSADLFKAPAI